MKLAKYLSVFGALSLTVIHFSFAEEPEPPVQTAATPKAASTTKPAKPVKSKVSVVKKKKVLKSAPATKSVPVEKAAPATSKPTQRESVMAWLKDLKKRVAHSQARQNQIVAVAAVRGSEAPDSPPLYWKGKKSSGNVDMPELKQFEEAIDNAIAGNSEDSKQKLQALVTNYPESPLVGDAQETLRKLEEPVTQ